MADEPTAMNPQSDDAKSVGRVFVDTSQRPLYLPWGLKMAAAWTLCVVIIGGGLWLISKALKPVLEVVVIPVMLAILIAALLKPVHNLLRKGIGNFAASVLSVLGFVVVIVGLLTLVGAEVASQLGQLGDKAMAGYQQFMNWLRSGPFGLDPGNMPEIIDNAVSSLVASLKANTSTIISGTVSAAQMATSVVVGGILVMFILIFFLADGEKIAEWTINLLPVPARERVKGASKQAWVTLGSYVRVQVLVAAIDAVGIAIGAAVLGVPLWIPIGVLVFIGSFVPIVGALLTGIVAMLVVLVSEGVASALVMIAIVIIVQQAESHILQPILMGRAVSLHPVAVVLAVAVGSTLLGIFGAVIAVPIVAVLNRVMHYLADPNNVDVSEVPDDPKAIVKRWNESMGGERFRRISQRLRRSNELIVQTPSSSAKRGKKSE